ncbi:RNA polymerase sigma factor (sigma-70 family) [Psychromicrobium silvestre]|uniref:RNA polymerase sigma factor (Sigma-70 family) n=1 Tax=Psychromicrobium silvestre TaxID=1645614 RepID=A0A7Y9LUC1_9MICC|nr:sigma-70 family RNA polymerase sigma factor [Psychromicrobium silvestre]NYE95742.1 RNA polymerase sigma factor (sigma-70 family) [Psychromicrobium silvestre]
MPSVADVVVPGEKYLAGDAQLAGYVREGDKIAFEVLYRRHRGIALAIARRSLDLDADAEDVVAEAFTYLFSKLEAGKGPDSSFRSYLLTAVRRIAHECNRASAKVQATDEERFPEGEFSDPDLILEAFESAAVAKAFMALPPRWRAVLWYLDVEGKRTSEAAKLLGISDGAVSAMAGRARDSLRSNYFQQHVSKNVPQHCSRYAGRLGRYVNKTLTRSAQQSVERHLMSCAKCTVLLLDLRDVTGRFSSVALLPAGISLGFFLCSMLFRAFGRIVRSVMRSARLVTQLGGGAKTAAAAAASTLLLSCLLVTVR